MRKIGLLLPRSTYYDTMGFDLFEGLRSGLKNNGLEEIKIITENISYGADKQQCYRGAEKLLLEENVELVVAYIGHRMAELLKPLFLAANKILLVLDAGANLPHEWPSCPNIFFHSLQNGFGAWLSAQKAAKDGFQEGGMVTNYYDGGYLHTYSITKGFESVGGHICFNHATGYKQEEFSMEALQQHLSQYPNSALLSLFSGDFVQWYFLEIKKWFDTKNVPIYLSPFGFEETMLENAVFPSNHVTGVAAWSKKIDSVENKNFIDSIEEAGRNPNLFSLLGWESAAIVNKILELKSVHKNKTIELAQDLKLFVFESPRGTVRFDTKTNTTLATLYNANLINNNGTCEVVLGDAITNLEEEFEQYSSLELNNITSAWYNSYTCI